jgi:hypothetical protein
MKATRRQELKTNELALFLKDVREFLSTYGNYFVGGLVVIALIALGYVYMTRSAAQALADARREISSLPFATDDEVRDSVAKLKRLASENDSETLILDALRRRAVMAMNRAHAADDGTPSSEFLDMARDAYEEMLQRFPDRHLDLGAALIGLATIEEDLFILDDDLAHKEEARGFLERIRDNANLNGTPFQTIALERLNALDQTFVQVVMVDTSRQTGTTADPGFKLSGELPSAGRVAAEQTSIPLPDQDTVDTAAPETVPQPQPEPESTEAPGEAAEQPTLDSTGGVSADSEPPPDENTE